MVFKDRSLRFRESIQISTDLGDHVSRKILRISLRVAPVEARPCTSDPPIRSVQLTGDEIGHEPAFPEKARLIFDDGGVAFYSPDEVLIACIVEQATTVREISRLHSVHLTRAI